MPRRSNHEGTFRKRRSYWEASVQLGGHRYWVTGRTRTETREKLQQLLQRHSHRMLAKPSRITLDDWAAQWLRECEGRLRPRTVLTYRQALSPLLALLGQRRLDRLEPIHVHHALEALREHGRGSRSRQQTHTYLCGCLERAKDLGLIGYNPASRVPKPRHQTQERPTWESEDMRRFLFTCVTSERPLASMFALQFLTGLRPGEALGLQWGDVDLGSSAIAVRRSVTWAGSRWHVQPPKTKAGERTLALPIAARRVIGCLPRSLPWLFWTRQPPTREFISRAMATLCDEATVPRQTPHYLRHAHATVLVSQGLDVKALQRRLGHTRASVTLDVYAHVLNEGDRRAATLIDGMLGQVGNHLP